MRAGLRPHFPWPVVRPRTLTRPEPEECPHGDIPGLNWEEGAEVGTGRARISCASQDPGPGASTVLTFLPKPWTLDIWVWLWSLRPGRCPQAIASVSLIRSHSEPWTPSPSPPFSRRVRMMLLAKPGRAWPGCCFPGESAQDWEGVAAAPTQPPCPPKVLRERPPPQGSCLLAALMPLLGSPSSELVGWLTQFFLTLKT